MVSNFSAFKCCEQWLGNPAPSASAAESFAHRILKLVEEPIIAGDHRIRLTASIGFLISGAPHKSEDEVLRDLHASLQEAKSRGPNNVQAWRPALKPALIFECVGIPGLLQQVFEGAPRDARIVVVGVCMETDRSEPMLGIMKELNVQYVLGYTPDEFACSLRLIAEGQVEAAPLVTATVGIDGIATAFADLANPERHTKIIVEPWR